jgi:very-short-patch-repair endonuclease
MSKNLRKLKIERRTAENLLASIVKKQSKNIDRVQFHANTMRLSPTQDHLQIKYLLKQCGYQYEFKKVILGGSQQYPIVDFYIPELKLILDITGIESNEDKIKRNNKNETLVGLGYTKVLLLESKLISNLTKDDLLVKLQNVQNKHRSFIINTKADKLRKRIQELDNKIANFECAPS